MKNKGVFFPFLLILLATFSCKNAPVNQTNTLARSTPEAQGISSEGIITFLDSAKSSKHEFHSIMILRHGKVVAEGWWLPYGPELKHTLYSTSKTFTSTAVGFAVTEKLLTVDDKVISFFPDELPDTVSENLASMTVKDLLTMSAGQDPDPTFTLRNGNDNWVKAFLSTPVVNKPGTKFLYNSMATYMLSAIVQKVTGQKVVDYLKTRLFTPLGIEGMDWEVDPKGINTGGWGLRVRTEDMARLGQLYLQKGKWNGTQVIPASWIEEASTAKIMQNPDARQSQKDSSDWLQGYCYQIWRCRNNAFRADGAYGQFIIVIPEKDAVVAITAESPDMQDEINMVWKYLLPAMKDEKLPENAELAGSLKTRLEKLTLDLPSGTAESKISGTLANKSFALEANDKKWQSLAFRFNDSVCIMTVFVDSVEYSFNFGKDKWYLGETSKPGPSLTGPLSGIDKYKTAGSYSWK